jgi:Protein of unknown function (DUF3455)
MKTTSSTAVTSTATVLLGAALLTACAVGGNMATAPAVPANLAPPAGEKQAFVHHARGVQIYRCATAAAGASGAAGANAAAFNWAFVAPQADLYASAAQVTVLGTHGAGPHWQAADGSRVTGVVKARADAPIAGAIPWLLLATTPGDKPGLMSAVTHIQRINTAAGVAPATGCAAAADAGKEARVPYTTLYVYFVRG